MSWLELKRARRNGASPPASRAPVRARARPREGALRSRRRRHLLPQASVPPLGATAILVTRDGISDALADGGRHEVAPARPRPNEGPSSATMLRRPHSRGDHRGTPVRGRDDVGRLRSRRPIVPTRTRPGLAAASSRSTTSCGMIASRVAVAISDGRSRRRHPSKHELGLSDPRLRDERELVARGPFALHPLDVPRAHVRNRGAPNVGQLAARLHRLPDRRPMFCCASER